MGRNAVAEVARLPKPRPIAYVTPSGAAAFRECLLRVAYGSDPEFRKEVPSGPAARLGTACHAVLEAAGAGQIGRPVGADWPEFEQAWAAAVRTQQEHAAAHPLEKHWPPPERWPGYAMRKLRTKRFSRKLAEAAAAARGGTSPKGVAALQEHWQEAIGGQLRGRADVIRREPEHIIEDYKTGAIYEDGTDELRHSYREQLLLYAVLEEAESGHWPVRAVLVPLEGEQGVIEIEPEDAERVAADAINNLHRYNSVIERDPSDLATPKPANCRYCPYSVRCPAFWRAVDEDWASEGVAAACGIVTASEKSRFGTVDLDIQAEAGSFGTGPLQLHALDPLQVPAEADIGPGDAVGVTGLRPSGRAAAQATPRTRLATVT